MTAGWDLKYLARALGGEVAGHQVLAPGPGHSPADRSLAVRPSASAPDGLLIHSHAADDWRACRDHVRAMLGIAPAGGAPAVRARPAAPVASTDEADRIARAAALWREGVDPRGTLVEAYLTSRALTLPDELANDVIRFHAACPWRDETTGKVDRVPAMLALMRQVRGNEITAVQRTALHPDGKKISRRMLGVAGGAAIKLDGDETVTHSLTIGEGFETCLAAKQALGFAPCWAVGSVTAIANFPVLAGIESLQLLEETGDNGASARAVETCALRWDAEGREVFVATPRGCKGDVNDVLMQWQRRKVG